MLQGATPFVKFPLLVFGALSLVGGLLTFSLPETLNQNLPDTIEQAEAMTYVHPGSELPAADTPGVSWTNADCTYS